MTWVVNASCWYHDNLMEAAILQVRDSHDMERRLTPHSSIRPLEKSCQSPCTKAGCLSLRVSNTQLTTARFNSCKALELIAALLSSSPHKEDSTDASQMELAQPQHQHFLENIHFRNCLLLTQKYSRDCPKESKTDRQFPNRYCRHSKTESIAYIPSIHSKSRLNTYFGEFCTNLGKVHK